MSSFGDKAFVMPQHRSAAASGIESGTASHSGLKAKSRHHGHVSYSSLGKHVEVSPRLHVFGGSR